MKSLMLQSGSKSKDVIIACVVVALVLVAGGVAAFLILNKIPTQDSVNATAVKTSVSAVKSNSFKSKSAAKSTKNKK